MNWVPADNMLVLCNRLCNSMLVFQLHVGATAEKDWQIVNKF
jgi:hypothetical protein